MFLNDGHSCIKRCRISWPRFMTFRIDRGLRPCGRKIRECGFEGSAKSEDAFRYLMENRGGPQVHVWPR